MTDTTTPIPRLGVVDGSIDATTRRFFAVLDDDALCQLDDLVVSRQQLPGGAGELAHYGIVVEQTGAIEGAELPTDTRHVAEGTMPGQGSRRVEIQILRTVPELWMAPAPGAAVQMAEGAERELALFCDQMEQQLPVGLDAAGRPVMADFSFVNGEQGGHVSISGVSGVAAKTSYALFLLHMLFENPTGRQLLGPVAPQTRALAFNVKGEDLLHLDRPNRRFSDEHRAGWAALGVENPAPFSSATFFVPPAPGHEDQLVSSAVTRPDARIYGWTPEAFIRQGLLRFCFADSEDTQVSFVEQRVRAELARHAWPLEGEDGAVVIVANEPHTNSRTFERIVEGRPRARQAGDGQVVRDWHDLLDFLVAQLDPDNTHNQAWTGATQSNTVMAFLRRLMALTPRLGHLLRLGVERVTLEHAAVTVVDIHALHQSAQRFVVGSLVSEIFEHKQTTGREPLRFILLDELNKYAPREGRSPLKELFIDIAERGRSLGVLLIGCQQAAGRVAEPVVSQPALKVCGRLDASEASDYRFLSAELRERATRFLPGTMVLDQPLIPAPLPVRFPFPPYATNVADADRTAEQAAEAAEVFDALAAQ